MKPVTLLVYVLCYLSISTAQSQSVELKSMAVQNQANYWRVTPHYAVELSEAMIEAIHNGIEITFVSELRLIAEKNWWPDTTLQQTDKRFEIHYFSLSSQYQLKQLNGDNTTSFMSLAGLLEQLTQKISFNLQHHPQATAVEARFYIDQRALPSTMQLPILLDPQWSLRAQPVRQSLPGMDEP